MYAIIEVGGQQFKVEKDQKIFVQKLEQKEGSHFDIESVLLLDNDKNVIVGQPLINGAKIVARVISHTKGDKVLIFKKKRRKGYQILNGHRPQFSEIMIEEIIENAAKETRSAAAKKEKQPAKDTETVSFDKEKAVSAEAVTGEAPVKAPKSSKVAAKEDKSAGTEESKASEKKVITKKPVSKTSEAKGKTSEKQAAVKKDEKKKAEAKTETRKPAAKKNTKK
jgi:large subunit ribosomal protein L21